MASEECKRIIVDGHQKQMYGKNSRQKKAYWTTHLKKVYKLLRGEIVYSCKGYKVECCFVEYSLNLNLTVF